MSILEGSASPQAPAAGSGPRSDRLRVITAGRVGNMEARLGTSGFDVVAAAETEDALIDAVCVDEPDAIVVEADLCASLEHVRDLAPDAVLIVVGDHTPAGALGRVERGMSGTAMAGLLHALVAEGVGAAVVWGLVPTFRAGALHVPHRLGLSMLSANADLVRAHLANALRDPAQLVTAAGTVALTVSASLLVTFSAPRTHERPEPVPVLAPTVERAARSRSSLCPPARTPAHGPSRTRASPATDGGRTAVSPGIMVVTTDQGKTRTTPIAARTRRGTTIRARTRPPKTRARTRATRQGVGSGQQRSGRGPGQQRPGKQNEGGRGPQTTGPFRGSSASRRSDLREGSRYMISRATGLLGRGLAANARWRHRLRRDATSAQRRRTVHPA